jgi:hypothetical protein
LILQFSQISCSSTIYEWYFKKYQASPFLLITKKKSTLQFSFQKRNQINSFDEHHIKNENIIKCKIEMRESFWYSNTSKRRKYEYKSPFKLNPFFITCHNVSDIFLYFCMFSWIIFLLILFFFTFAYSMMGSNLMRICF